MQYRGHVGAVAQLGERMNGIHEVRGSIPLSSTMYLCQKVREVCKAMRLAGVRSLLFWAAAVFMAGSFAGCDNPFDPLKSSDKIEGLKYFDFSATQEHWDSDPDWDGMQITLSYYNEFGDALNFHDKPHKVQIEFWSEVDDSSTPPVKVRGSLLTTKTVEFSNSDDLIRIPIEFYGGSIGLPSTTSITGFLLVRIFPPKAYPQRELIAPIQAGQEFYTPEDVPSTP
jgi:hypothetical protein